RYDYNEVAPERWAHIAAKPSEYIKGGRVFFSCEPGDEFISFFVEHLGEDAMLFASDYLHFDALFVGEPGHDGNPYPGTVATLLGRKDVSDSAKRKMLLDNSLRFYGMDKAALGHRGAPVTRSALRCDGARAQLGREQSEERLRGGRELACAAIHDADRAAEGTFDGRSSHQGARADLGNERRCRQERQAEAGLNGALDRLDVVELHGVANPHPVTAQEAVDQAAGGNVAVEADERLAVENGERTAGAPRE